jgi:hypothetical protein
VAGRVKWLAGIVAAGEAEVCQDTHSLVPDRAKALDDGIRIRFCMLNGAVQVVHDGQPLPRRLGARLRPHPIQVPGEAFTQVIRVGEGPPPLLLRGIDPRLQVRERRGRFLGRPRAARRKAGLGVALRPVPALSGAPAGPPFCCHVTPGR